MIYETKPMLATMNPPEPDRPPSPTFPDDPQPNPIPDRPDPSPVPSTPAPQTPPINDPKPPQVDW